VQAMYETHPQHFIAYNGFATEVGDREAWGLLTRKGMSPDAVLGRWQEGLRLFMGLRERYLLYR
jgi:hypothetical protein